MGPMSSELNHIYPFETQLHLNNMQKFMSYINTHCIHYQEYPINPV